MAGYASEVLTDRAILLQALDDEPIVGRVAWSAGLNVEGFLRWVTADLDRCPSITVDAAVFDHYGSGYASYAEVFVTKRDGIARRRGPNGSFEVECLSVLLCRLGAMACLLGPDLRSGGYDRTGVRPLPTAQRVTFPPVPGWEHESRQIAAVLDRHGIALADPDTLTRPLPEGLTVTSALASPLPTVFDAWFHWSD